MKNLSVRIAPALEEKDDAIFEFLEESFFPEEPLNSSLNRFPKRSDFRPLDYVKAGYSFVAYVKGDDGQEHLAGVVINKVERKGEEKRKKPQDATAHPIFDILEKLDGKVDKWDRITSDEVFHIVILAVGKNFRGLNIGRKLVEQSLSKAVAWGFTFAEIECTGCYSARIVNSLGFERICEIRYDSHRDENGEVIFKTEKEHQELVKFIKKL